MLTFFFGSLSETSLVSISASFLFWKRASEKVTEHSEKVEVEVELKTMFSLKLGLLE